MRRVHLRGHVNIRKRLLIHTAGFNLGLLMRRLIGVGTPRGLQGRLAATLGTLLTLLRALWRPIMRHWGLPATLSPQERVSIGLFDFALSGVWKMAFTTGC